MRLYAIKNKSTQKYIFNSRGGAYQDKERAVKKAKKLSQEDPGTMYEIVVFEEVDHRRRVKRFNRFLNFRKGR